MASTIDRNELRDKIRALLNYWPDLMRLEAAMDPETDTLRVRAGQLKDFIQPSGVLEIESEVLKVIDLPAESDTVRVMRGHMNTTAANHVINTQVRSYGRWGWTNSELNLLINDAIRWLKPAAWIDALSDTFTWSADTHVVDVPAASGISRPDGNYIYQLEHLNSGDSIYYPMRGWQLIGDTLHLRSNTAVGRTLRARYCQFQAALTGDTTNLDNDDFAEAIASRTAELALISMGTNRVRYTEYSAALDDRASTADELIRMAFNLRNMAERAKEQAARPLPSGFASTYRQPRP